MKKLFTLLFTFLCTVFAFAGTGTKTDPYTVAEAIANQNNATAYVKGFIVGTVKADLSTVTGNGDVEWAAPFNRNTVVVLADSKTTNDVSKCVFVNLPTGEIRDVVNLVSNPGNLGKWLNIQGVLRTYFGQAGLRDIVAFEIEGASVGNVIFEESFATNEGAFTIDDKSGAQVWNWRNNPNAPTSPGYMYMSGHDGTNNVPNEDWLISPAFSLETAKAGSYVTFKHAIKFATQAEMQVNQTLWITDGVSEEKLTVVNYPIGTDWTFVDAGNMLIPSTLLGKSNVKIIFKYHSTATSGGAWEVKDVKVVDPSTTSVESLEERINVQVYPNPATDKLNVNVGDLEANIELFDMTGKLVNTFNNVSGVVELNTGSLNRGIYMVKVSSGNATEVKKVVIK